MKSSLSTRLVVFIVPLVLLVFAFLIGAALLLAIDSQKDLAYKAATNQAAQYADAFDADLRVDQTIARTLAQVMDMNATANRQEVLDVLKILLDQNPETIGTYVLYEPNAFDGKDAAFAGADGSDPAGRFSPYWNKLTGSETLSGDSTGADTADYYVIPKTTRADSVIEPYLYDGVVMTSFTSPILKAGKFIGITGVDTSLTSWDQRVSQIKTYTTGYAFLVSKTGIFISAPDKAYIGAKTLADLPGAKTNQKISQMSADIQAGKAGQIETVDPFTGKSVVMFYAPVRTGGWGLVTVVPQNEMMASVDRMGITLGIIGLIGILLLFGLIFWISKMITRPIAAVQLAASRIADGDLGVTLDNHSADEIGQLADDRLCGRHRRHSPEDRGRRSDGDSSPQVRK